MGRRKESTAAEGGLPPRDQWQRYAPVKGMALAGTISITSLGAMTISSDLAAKLGDNLYIVPYASPPGPVTKMCLILEPGKKGELGALKGQTDTHGSRRYNVKSALHQLGIDDFAGVSHIPAVWTEGVIAGDLTKARDATPRTRSKSATASPAPDSAGTPQGRGGPKYEGRARCPECGEQVPWRMVNGHRKFRAHKAPDGVACDGEKCDDGD